MKKTILAAAVLTLVSGLATAQSNVTMYGIVDLGVLTQNHAAAGAAKNSVASGGIAPSIWGFRGTEDLGGGLKANFNLEGHIAADTGAAIGPLLRRQSNVGLSSADFGTVMLGNQYSPAILAFAATDPRGLRENFSGLYSWAYNSGALTAGNNGNNDVGVFVQNAISYSNKFGAVGVAGAYRPDLRRPAVVLGRLPVHQQARLLRPHEHHRYRRRRLHHGRADGQAELFARREQEHGAGRNQQGRRGGPGAGLEDGGQ
jgi:predicted porin